MDGKKKYEEKMKRIDDALALREPDRVLYSKIRILDNNYS